jgi:hypothetical protein
MLAVVWADEFVLSIVANKLTINVVFKTGRIFFILFSDVSKLETSYEGQSIIPVWHCLSYASVVFDRIFVPSIGIGRPKGFESSRYNAALLSPISDRTAPP